MPPITVYDICKLFIEPHSQRIALYDLEKEKIVFECFADEITGTPYQYYYVECVDNLDGSEVFTINMCVD